MSRAPRDQCARPPHEIPQRERIANRPVSGKAPRGRESQLSRLGEPSKSRTSAKTVRRVRRDDEFRNAQRRRKGRIIHADGSGGCCRPQPKWRRKGGNTTPTHITLWTLCRK